MGTAVHDRKIPGKDIGSWLIFLGYVIVIVGTVNIVQGWISKPAVLDVIEEEFLSPQGFAPYLDPSRSLPFKREGPISSFEQVTNSASSPHLASIESWESPVLDDQDPSSTISDELHEGTGLERWLPEYLAIPTIGLDVPITAAEYEKVEINGETYRQWLAPDSRTAGWQPASASLGVPGNTVLIGHHNVFGEVFRNLEKLEIGNRIKVYSGERSIEYQVSLKMILPEKYESIETRIENARWIQPTQDERLTLVTCWPYETNSYRMIIVAEPVGRDSMGIWENRYAHP